jgi:hypothetical protein
MPSSSSQVAKHGWKDRTGSELKLPQIVTSASTSSFFATLPISQPEQSHFQSPAILTRQTLPPHASQSSTQRSLENFSHNTNGPAAIHQLSQLQLSHFKHPAEYHQVKRIFFFALKNPVQLHFTLIFIKYSIISCIYY